MNNKSKNSAASGGIGILGLFGVAFIVLKLCDVIVWSWLWVLSPFWVPVAVIILILLVYIFVYAFIDRANNSKTRKHERSRISKKNKYII